LTSFSRRTLLHGVSNNIYIFVLKKNPIIGPRCPEGSRKLWFPDYMTMAQNGGGCQPYAPAAFYPQDIILDIISVRD